MHSHTIETIQVQERRVPSAINYSWCVLICKLAWQFRAKTQPPLILAESLDKKGRHNHYLQEVIELEDGDEISIAACEVGGESDRNWRDQCHIENNEIELDTRLGYFSFIVMEDAETPN